MRHLTLIAAVCAAALLSATAKDFAQTTTSTRPAATSPAATQATTQAAVDPSMLGPYYSGMVKYLDLPADKQAQIADAYGRQRTAQAKFLAEKKDQWAKAMEKADSQDPAEAADGKQQVARLNAAYDDLTAAEQAKVMALLTKEQALAWDTLEMKIHLTSQIRVQRIGHGPGGAMTATAIPLTDQQQKVIDKHAAEAAKEFQAQKDPYDAAMRRDAKAKLLQKVKDELTKEGIMPTAEDGAS